MLDAGGFLEEGPGQEQFPCTALHFGVQGITGCIPCTRSGGWLAPGCAPLGSWHPRRSEVCTNAGSFVETLARRTIRLLANLAFLLVWSGGVR
jgi:hypothetical protein